MSINANIKTEVGARRAVPVQSSKDDILFSDYFPVVAAIKLMDPPEESLGPYDNWRQLYWNCEENWKRGAFQNTNPDAINRADVFGYKNPSRFHDLGALVCTGTARRAPADIKGATIIGGGPSLLKNYDAVSKKTLNLCADSSLKFCLDRGVKIDYVTTVDPQPSVAKFFENCDTSKLRLIAPVTIPPETIQAWEGEIYWHTDIPQKLWGEGEGQKKNLIDLAEGMGKAAGLQGYVLPAGNVGCTSIMIAAGIFNIKNIFLVGFDYSWTEGKYHVDERINPPHATLKIENPETGASELRDEVYQSVDDINGRPVLTNITYNQIYLPTLIKIMRLINTIGGHIYNCTEGGIVNESVLSLKEAYDIHAIV